MEPKTLFEAFAAGALSNNAPAWTWTDSFKLVLPVVLGAISVMATGRIMLRLTARIEEERKGNFAVLQLGLLHATCADLMKSLQEEDRRFAALIPPNVPQSERDKFPRWFHVRNLTHVVDTDAKFDLEALLFLIDDPANGALLSHLHLAAQRHRLLFTTALQFAELRKTANEKIAASGLTTFAGQRGLEELTTVVGTDLHVMMGDMVDSLRNDGPATGVYINKTANDLTRAMERKFKNEKWFYKILGKPLKARWSMIDRTLTHIGDDMLVV